MSTETKKKITVKPFEVKTMCVTIEGDSDLMLNKMTRTSQKEIIGDFTGTTGKKTKAPINMYQQLVESIHWMDGEETDLTEEGWKNAIKNNRVGYSASGIKKGICDAAVRVLGESKSTIINANLQVIPEKADLVPIEFTGHAIDESLITSQFPKGTFLVYRNVFSGWSSTFKIQYRPDVFSTEQVIELVQAMGFACGIGCRRVGLKGGTNGQFHVSAAYEYEGVA